MGWWFETDELCQLAGQAGVDLAQQRGCLGVICAGLTSPERDETHGVRSGDSRKDGDAHDDIVDSGSRLGGCELGDIEVLDGDLKSRTTFGPPARGCAHGAHTLSRPDRSEARLSPARAMPSSRQD